MVLLYACKSKEEELKEAMLPVIRELTLQDSLVTKLDSIIIYKIDTLTDAKTALRRLFLVNDQMELFNSMAKSQQLLSDLYKSNADSRISSARLYYNVLDSEVLGDIERDNAREEFKKSRERLKESNLMLDSSEIMSTIATKLLSDLNNKKLDSTTFRGYIPRYIVKGADAKGVQVVDSMYVYLSKDLHIIKIKAY